MNIEHDSRFSPWLPLGAIAVLAALGVGFWLGRSGTLDGTPAASKDPMADSEASDRPKDGVHTADLEGQTQIQLPAAMVRSASLQSCMIEVTHWEEERTIPAKLELDPGRHYAVTAPADVIVDELLVPLGGKVERGQPLLSMSSSQITTLRGGLLRQQLLTEKAQRALTWHLDIKTRIEQMIDQVRLRKEPLPEQWVDVSAEHTADFGAKIFGEYAKYWSAYQLSKISQRSINSGVVAERSIVERLTELESAKASLQGAIEQSKFDIQQAILAAESDLASAEGSLQSIQSEMRRFLGLRAWDDSMATDVPFPEQPDRFLHRSPGEGVVLERYFANGERASVGELIVLVADTSKLWLVGDLRQQDWDLLQRNPGDRVVAEVVGLESLGRLSADIEMIGGVVQTVSGSIRMTASLSNERSLLRPGMIARLVISQMREGIRIPATAIFSNDGQDYVLRKENETTFVLVPVKVGSRKQSTVEILEGLQSGQRVLTSGVFPIASQAFLEEEE